jgi:hypothetical protein
MLRLAPFLDRLLTNGRSKNITVVFGAQRPVEISRFALGEATILVSFAGDSRDATTIAEATTKDYGQSVLTLGRHEFSVFDKVSREFRTGTLATLPNLLVKG